MSQKIYSRVFKLIIFCQYVLAILYLLISVIIIMETYDCEYFVLMTLTITNAIFSLLEAVVGTMIVNFFKNINLFVIGSLVINHLDIIFIRWYICISLASVLGSVGLAAASLNQVLNPCANDVPYTQISAVCLFTSLSVGISSDAVSLYILYKIHIKLTEDSCGGEKTIRDVNMDNELYEINNNADETSGCSTPISQRHDVATSSVADDYESVNVFLSEEQRNDSAIEMVNIYDSTESDISPTPKARKEISLSISSKKDSDDESIIGEPLTKWKHDDCDAELDTKIYIGYKDEDSPNGCLSSISQTHIVSSSAILPNERENEEPIRVPLTKEQCDKSDSDIEIDNKIYVAYNPQISNGYASKDCSDTAYDEESIDGFLNEEQLNHSENDENSHKK